jgi:hypothetical protein
MGQIAERRTLACSETQIRGQYEADLTQPGFVTFNIKS